MSFLNPFAKLPPADDFLVEHAVGTYNRLAPPADKVITFAVQQKFKSLSGQDMKLKDKEGNVIARIDGKNLSIRSRAVISDKNGTPIVCILEKVLSMSPASFVYSFKPYFEGQKPTEEKQDGKPLYAWAKIWKKLMSVTDEFEICMAVGDDVYQEPGHGLFKAKAPSMTSPKLQVWKDGRGCALIDRKVLDWGELIDINAHELTVAKGIDPILMLCLVSVKDDLEGKGQ